MAARSASTPEPCPTCAAVCPYCPRRAPPEGWPAWIRANRPEHDFTTPTDRARAATPDPGNVHHRRWLLVAGCDYRGPRVGCGCDGRHRCHRGVVGSYGPGEVTYGDCLACVGAARAGSG